MTTLGIDIGGTKILAVRVDGTGRVTGRRRVPTPSGGRAAVLDAVVRLVTPFRDSDPAVGAMGIGFPGLVEQDQRRIRSSVILPGFEEFDLASWAEEACGFSCGIDNDVNHAARAELSLREPPDESFLLITVGTGIGGAIVWNGSLWRGAGGFAGEVGHISVDRRGPRCTCGRRGCLGVLASGSALRHRVAQPPERWPEVWENGDPDFQEAVRETAELLGEGLANAINLMSFPKVIVGGALADFGERYLDWVRCSVRNHAFDEIAALVPIEAARAGYDAGAIGAALFAREISADR